MKVSVLSLKEKYPQWFSLFQIVGVYDWPVKLLLLTIVVYDY